MRRLSIATAHAFLLVYTVTSAASLVEVKQCFEEIREQRADFQVSHRKVLSCWTRPTLSGPNHRPSDFRSALSDWDLSLISCNESDLKLIGVCREVESPSSERSQQTH